MVERDAHTAWVMKVRDHWGKVIQSRAYLTLSGVRTALAILEKQGLHCEVYEISVDDGVRVDKG